MNLVARRTAVLYGETEILQASPSYQETRHDFTTHGQPCFRSFDGQKAINCGIRKDPSDEAARLCASIFRPKPKTRSSYRQPERVSCRDRNGHVYRLCDCPLGRRKPPAIDQLHSATSVTHQVWTVVLRNRGFQPAYRTRRFDRVIPS
jgi:hypothetical protein